MKLIYVPLLAFVSALSSVGSVLASSVVVSDDTWVEGDATSSVFGSNATVLAKNNGSNNTNVRFPFFRFDLSNYSDAFDDASGLNLVIISANQGSRPSPPQSYAGAVSNGPATFVVELWGLTQSVEWSESTLTWNEAHRELVSLGTGYANQAGRGFNPDQASLLATCSVPASSVPFAWFCSSKELTDFMNARLGSNHATLMFRRTDTNSQANWGAASKEYVNSGEGINVGDFAPTFGPRGVFGDGLGPAPTGTYQGGDAEIAPVADETSVSDNIVEAIIKGRVTDTGGDNPERFCRFREQGSDEWIVTFVGVGPSGDFACSVSGLKPDTVYETQTFVTNAGGTVFEDVTLLTTPPAAVESPVLDSLSVSSGGISGGATLTITGNRFVIEGTQVQFGSEVGLNVSVLDATQLSVAVPSASAAGEVNVVVTTSGGASSALQYTYEADAPGTLDSDGDGVSDDQDAFPNDATETTDTDGDGLGDNADPNDANTDSDGDGVADGEDVFPSDADESADADGDGLGDNADPNDGNTDSDGDGIADGLDGFPLANTFEQSGGVTLETELSSTSSSCSLANLTLFDVATEKVGVAIDGIGFAADFSLEGCDPDSLESVEVKLDLGVTPANGAEAFKILASGRWIPVADALIEGRVITYTVVDNGPLDTDSRRGFISDPVTLAVPVPSVPVPTLPGVMLGVLALLIALLGRRKFA